MDPSLEKKTGLTKKGIDTLEGILALKRGFMRRSTKNYWNFVGVALLLYFLALAIVAANENREITRKMTPTIDPTVSLNWYIVIALLGALALMGIVWAIVSKNNKLKLREVIKNKKDNLMLLSGPILGATGAIFLGFFLIGSMPQVQISVPRNEVAQADPMSGQVPETLYQAPIPDLPPLLPTKNLVDIATGVVTISDQQTIAGDYTAVEPNQSCLLALDQSAVTVDQATFSKTGDPTTIEDALKYGLNAALLVAPGGTANVLGSNIQTQASGAGGIAVNGLNSSAIVNATNVDTEGSNSPAFFSAFQGELKVTGGDQTSKGDGSPVFASRASSSILADFATCQTAGYKSPIVRASGLFSGTSLQGVATNSIAAQIEPGGTVNLVNSNLTAGAVQSDTNYHAVFIFDNQDHTQKQEPGHLTIINSEWKVPSSSPAAQDGYNFIVDQCSAAITLNGNSILNVPKCARVQNGWIGLSLSSQVLGGVIEGDENSAIDLNISEASRFDGAINPDQVCKKAIVHLDASSTMNLTADIYLTEFTNENTSNSNIQTNGHHIYLNGQIIL